MLVESRAQRARSRRRGRESSRPTREPARRSLLPLALAGLLLLFVLLPLVALVWRSTVSTDFWPSLTRPSVLRSLRLTAITSAITVALAIVTGTPAAYLLARRSFPGKRLVETLIDLPLVLPPVVAGVALLMAFGRRGLLGHQLEVLGIELPFTTAAVVLAQLFVAAPFYVRGARLGFLAVPRELEQAAAIHGASSWTVFRQITLPLALPGIASGAILCWARALSEFGATLMFAGNIAGRTQTMSLAIVSAMESDLGAALAISVLLVAAAGLVLFLSRLLPTSRLEP
jgi:molybdate transport system permease protein